MTIRFFCTAKWIAQPLISACIISSLSSLLAFLANIYFVAKQKKGATKVHSALEVKLDSMLSTKLSYDEVTTEGSAIGEGSYGTVRRSLLFSLLSSFLSFIFFLFFSYIYLYRYTKENGGECR